MSDRKGSRSETRNGVSCRGCVCQRARGFRERGWPGDGYRTGAVEPAEAVSDIRRPARARAARGDFPGRFGPRDDSRRPALVADPRRRAARRSGLPRPCPPSPISSRTTAARATRPRKRPRSGCCSTATTSTSSARCWESQPDRMVANEMRRDNTSIVAERQLRVRVRHVLRSPQRRRLRRQRRSAAAIDGQVTNERQMQQATGTRSGS